MRHLTVKAILAIHRQVLSAHGGGDGIRDMSLLESAVAAPQATFGGEAIIKDEIEAAAAYLFYLCNNHPFVDGNRRVALASCLTFLISNNLMEIGELHVDVWEEFTLIVAASKFDREKTTRALRKLMEDV